MVFFHGGRHAGGYFEGWYFKQQNQGQTVAFIPAYHVDVHGAASASLQVITEEEAFSVNYPAGAFRAEKNRPAVRLGESLFTPYGCRLHCASRAGSAQGVLRFRRIVRPAYGIMGPFSKIPFLQCRHEVFSVRHQVDGVLVVNGRPYRFDRGEGYLEGDRGCSFPQRYVWTQCCHNGVSVMLSVADIPFPGARFTGCIGFVWAGGREYRIATYLGARPVLISGREVCVRQGELFLFVRLLGGGGHPLQAPVKGGMNRVIRESPACPVRYRLQQGRKTIVDFVCERASFENAWQDVQTRPHQPSLFHPMGVSEKG